MKKLSLQEIKDTKNGIRLDVSSDAIKKSRCKIKTSKIKVYPFYEEKTFKMRNKVFPAVFIQNNEKYIAMVVKDKVVSVSPLFNASLEFQKFAKKL